MGSSPNSLVAGKEIGFMDQPKEKKQKIHPEGQIAYRYYDPFDRKDFFLEIGQEKALLHVELSLLVRISSVFLEAIQGDRHSTHLPIDPSYTEDVVRCALYVADKSMQTARFTKELEEIDYPHCLWLDVTHFAFRYDLSHIISFLKEKIMPQPGSDILDVITTFKSPLAQDFTVQYKNSLSNQLQKASKVILAHRTNDVSEYLIRSLQIPVDSPDAQLIRLLNSNEHRWFQNLREMSKFSKDPRSWRRICNEEKEKKILSHDETIESFVLKTYTMRKAYPNRWALLATLINGERVFLNVDQSEDETIREFKLNRNPEDLD
jgi:hypothetical protein